MGSITDLAARQERERQAKYSGFGDWRDAYGRLEDYAIRKGRLCRVRMKMNPDTKDLYPEYIPLSNFAAHIAKEVTRDDGAETKTVFEVEGYLHDGRALPCVAVDAAKFAGMTWATELWGSDVIVSPGSNNRDYLRHAIQEVSFGGNKERQTVYTHTGWRKIGGRWVYLHACGAIGADDVTVDVSNEGYLTRYTIPSNAVNKQEAARMTLRFLDVAGDKITIPLFALIHLAPLCEPLRQAGREPAFVIWLHGVTQSMKSSLAAVALSHFGEFSALNLPASFKDTTNSLERKGFLLKDSLLVVDDFHPSATRAEAMEMAKKAQAVFRGYGDRVGRGRLWADGTLRKSYPPRGMCLVTGEDLPDVGQSGAARFMSVSIQKGDINTAILSELQANTGLLAGHMRNYIEWLAPHIDEIAGEVKEEVNRLRDGFIKNGLTGRIPDIAAWLYYSLNVAAKYFVEAGAMSEDDQDLLLQGGLDALMETAREQARLTITEQPATKFIAALSEMLTVGNVHVKSLHETSDNMPGFIGWADEQYYYLLPEQVYGAVVQFYIKQNCNFPVSKATLWKHLKTAGMIDTALDAPTKLKKINGKAQRLLWLKGDALRNDGDQEDF